MTNNNTLTSLLNNNRLTGSIYLDWKQKIILVLKAEKIHNVLTSDVPHLPKTTDGDDYIAWEPFRQKDALATDYILSSIDKSMQSSCDDMETAKEVMKHLETTFGKQDPLVHQRISSMLFTSKMADGTTILDHMIKLNKHFKDLEGFGTLFDLDFKIEINFASLSDAYGSFIMYYHMNKVVIKNVSELTNMFVEAESRLKKSKVVALVTEKSFQSSKNKKKKRTNKREEM
ncbi:uncharacterized protein LOC122672202 [Telopea speciosissima]|uniref:uncharacterized protein LOC122672202 n=1 Tax=Telopea speciosissima TaxID=54955 RepID=UPI001CC4F8B7|nr:uncharacterized protein LOC122672202 [Telopea speciosissima]